MRLAKRVSGIVGLCSANKFTLFETSFESANNLKPYKMSGFEGDEPNSSEEVVDVGTTFYSKDLTVFYNPSTGGQFEPQRISSIRES